MMNEIDLSEIDLSEIEEDYYKYLDDISEKIYVYILKSKNPKHKNLTYIGKTNNLERRLRQHNREIVGGAKKTKKGVPWVIAGYITGKLDLRSSLQLEWKLQHPFTKKDRKILNLKKEIGLNRIKRNVDYVLSLDKFTQNCIPSIYLDCEVEWLL